TKPSTTTRAESTRLIYLFGRLRPQPRVPGDCSTGPDHGQLSTQHAELGAQRALHPTVLPSQNRQGKVEVIATGPARPRTCSSLSRLIATFSPTGSSPTRQTVTRQAAGHLSQRLRPRIWLWLNSS